MQQQNVPGLNLELAEPAPGPIGAVARNRLLPRAGISPGNALIGVASSGLHTNGYSLARQVAQGLDLHDPVPGGDGTSIGEALCAVHRSYLPVLDRVLADDLALALAHITGGGLLDNVPRVLPNGIGARIDVDAWPRPALFEWLIGAADLDIEDAHRIFNCGIGMVVVVDADRAPAVQAAIDEPTWVIGETVADPASRVTLA